MNLNRRSLLGAAFAAPFVVTSAGVLMPVRRPLTEDLPSGLLRSGTCEVLMPDGSMRSWVLCTGDTVNIKLHGRYASEFAYIRNAGRYLRTRTGSLQVV